jgi:uncharacterized protein (DUF427 family)
MSTNSGPGYKQMPNHTITLERPAKRVQVTFGGDVIADSDDVIELREGSYPPVYYLPRGHVKMERLVRTEHRTHCPFKGDASYFSLTGSRSAENAVWTYETPYDEVSDIRDRLAFYPNRVDAITVSEPDS